MWNSHMPQSKSFKRKCLDRGDNFQAKKRKLVQVAGKIVGRRDARLKKVRQEELEKKARAQQAKVKAVTGTAISNAAVPTAGSSPTVGHAASSNAVGTVSSVPNTTACTTAVATGADSTKTVTTTTAAAVLSATGAVVAATTATVSTVTPTTTSPVPKTPLAATTALPSTVNTVNVAAPKMVVTTAATGTVAAGASTTFSTAALVATTAAVGTFASCTASGAVTIEKPTTAHPTSVTIAPSPVLTVGTTTVMTVATPTTTISTVETRQVATEGMGSTVISVAEAEETSPLYSDTTPMSSIDRTMHFEPATAKTVMSAVQKTDPPPALSAVTSVVQSLSMPVCSAMTAVASAVVGHDDFTKTVRGASNNSPVAKEARATAITIETVPLCTNAVSTDSAGIVTSSSLVCSLPRESSSVKDNREVTTTVSMNLTCSVSSEFSNPAVAVATLVPSLSTTGTASKAGSSNQELPEGGATGQAEKSVLVSSVGAHPLSNTSPLSLPTEQHSLNVSSASLISSAAPLLNTTSSSSTLYPTLDVSTPLAKVNLARTPYVGDELPAPSVYSAISSCVSQAVSADSVLINTSPSGMNKEHIIVKHEPLAKNAFHTSDVSMASSTINDSAEPSFSTLNVSVNSESTNYESLSMEIDGSIKDISTNRAQAPCHNNLQTKSSLENLSASTKTSIDYKPEFRSTFNSTEQFFENEKLGSLESSDSDDAHASDAKTLTSMSDTLLLAKGTQETITLSTSKEIEMIKPPMELEDRTLCDTDNRIPTHEDLEKTIYKENTNGALTNSDLGFEIKTTSVKGNGKDVVAGHPSKNIQNDVKNESKELGKTGIIAALVNEFVSDSCVIAIESKVDSEPSPNLCTNILDTPLPLNTDCVSKPTEENLSLSTKTVLTGKTCIDSTVSTESTVTKPAEQEDVSETCQKEISPAEATENIFEPVNEGGDQGMNDNVSNFVEKSSPSVVLRSETAATNTQVVEYEQGLQRIPKTKEEISLERPDKHVTSNKVEEWRHQETKVRASNETPQKTDAVAVSEFPSKNSIEELLVEQEKRTTKEMCGEHVDTSISNNDDEVMDVDTPGKETPADEAMEIDVNSNMETVECGNEELKNAASPVLTASKIVTQPASVQSLQAPTQPAFVMTDNSAQPVTLITSEVATSAVEAENSTKPTSVMTETSPQSSVFLVTSDVATPSVSVTTGQSPQSTLIITTQPASLVEMETAPKPASATTDNSAISVPLVTSEVAVQSTSVTTAQATKTYNAAQSVSVVTSKLATQPTSVPTAQSASEITLEITTQPTSVSTTKSTLVVTSELATQPTSVSTTKSASVVTLETATLPTSVSSTKSVSVVTSELATQPTSVSTTKYSSVVTLETATLPTSVSSTKSASVVTSELATQPTSVSTTNSASVLTLEIATQPTSVSTTKSASVVTSGLATQSTDISSTKSASVVTLETATQPTSVSSTKSASVVTSVIATRPTSVSTSVETSEVVAKCTELLEFTTVTSTLSSAKSSPQTAALLSSSTKCPSSVAGQTSAPSLPTFTAIMSTSSVTLPTQTQPLVYIPDVVVTSSQRNIGHSSISTAPVSTGLALSVTKTIPSVNKVSVSASQGRKSSVEVGSKVTQASTGLAQSVACTTPKLATIVQKPILPSGIVAQGFSSAAGTTQPALLNIMIASTAGSVTSGSMVQTFMISTPQGMVQIQGVPQTAQTSINRATLAAAVRNIVPQTAQQGVGAQPTAVIPRSILPSSQLPNQVNIPLMQGANVVRLDAKGVAQGSQVVGSTAPVRSIAALVASIPTTGLPAGQAQTIRFVTPSGGSLMLPTAQIRSVAPAGTTQVPPGSITLLSTQLAKNPSVIAPKTVATSTPKSSVNILRSQQQAASVGAQNVRLASKPIKLEKFPILRPVIRDPRKLIDYKIARWPRRHSVTSIFRLERRLLKSLGRRAGMKEVKGFLYSTKTAGITWPASFPKPSFKVGWRYRTQSLKTLAGAGLQCRILHSCLKWEEMSVRPPRSNSTTLYTSSGNE